MKDNISTDRQLSMIDLFAGCGGLSLGFELEGFTPLLFSEINLNAAQTYMMNRPKDNVVPVGDVYSLTNDNLRLLREMWRLKGISEIDVVCGGPPCQGYSGIGHRRSFDVEKDAIPSNQLFSEMVRVVSFLQPRAFLFENVKGLLSGRWTKNGKKGEIFRDVLSAFQSIPEYSVGWDLLHAKDYGVPQNRPRVVIVGYRQDVLAERANPLLNGFSEDPSPYLGRGDARDLGYIPVGNVKAPTLSELLGDLIDPSYREKGITKRYPHAAQNQFQRWLRKSPEGKVAGKGAPLTEHEYSKHSPAVMSKFAHMIKNDGEIPESMRTKKFAQRVLPEIWNRSGPNITATSLPDDYVHFAQPRVPSVREWARIQTFPDWYQFAGPRTTGGRRRAGDPDAGLWDREVPKYTQIGNAVPVFLAQHIAKHMKSILSGSNEFTAARQE
ncbi:DNA cytosine methyltransferase [Haloferula rosea]|uniref:Cytosine-specific methyltransferase n=1 Tax=Haloferula rosea TaxID=490093 RepID=A0A934RCA5_9BACT|nr:DNA cytosine methyltransferase [Haloferula rosea]MBK1828487.1 DNA cytosine methyltransferase [Haloferula rosea]